MAYTTTPDMGLTLPVVLGEPGPAFATDINNSLTTVDSHNHTSGSGALVPTAGLNINADLSFTGFGPINQQYSRLTPTTLPSPGLKPDSLFVDASGNLWYENSTSNQIQITAFGSISPSGTGANNGFFNFGGTGYAGIAQAGFNQTNGQYLFFKTAGGNTSSNTLADMIIGKNLYLAGAAQQSIFFRSAGSTPETVPTTGGSYLQTFNDVNGNPNGLTWNTWDTSLATPAYQAAVKMGAAGYNGVSSLQVNVLGQAVAVAYQGASCITQSTTIGDYEYHDMYSTITPAAGFGMRVRYRLANAAAALGQTAPVNAASIEVRASNHTGPITNIALRGASSGTYSTNPGIDVSGVGNGAVGILTAAGTTTGIVTVGGAVVPASDDTYNLGSTAAAWGNGYIDTVTSQQVYTSVATTVPVASVGGYFKNTQVLSYGTIPSGGGSVTPSISYNISTGSSPSWSSNTCTITLGQSLSGGCQVVVSPASTSASTFDIVQGEYNGSNTITVTTFSAAGGSVPTAAAAPFSYILVGSP